MPVLIHIQTKPSISPQLSIVYTKECNFGNWFLPFLASGADRPPLSGPSHPSSSQPCPLWLLSNQRHKSEKFQALKHLLENFAEILVTNMASKPLSHLSWSQSCPLWLFSSHSEKWEHVTSTLVYELSIQLFYNQSHEKCKLRNFWKNYICMALL